MQISGDCATLGWNRSMKQLDVKDVLPCRNTQDSIISNGQDQQKAEDALQPVIDEKTPQLKKRKPRLEKKKKETIEDGYQKLRKRVISQIWMRTWHKCKQRAREDRKLWPSLALCKYYGMETLNVLI